MRVVHFYAKHLPSINKWLKQHGRNPVSLKDLPMHGYLVPGVAAGFLRECEGRIGIVDSLVSNPYASSGARHKAMEAIYGQFKAHPSFDRLLGFTIDDGALGRAKMHGFKEIAYTVLSYSRS